MYDNNRRKAPELYKAFRLYKRFREVWPLKNQAYRMALLYDFYGDMLTDRQKEFYDLYYNEDLSLAEIAENYGITRQGVRDVIVRAEGILSELEEKTGIIHRFHQMQGQFDEIRKAVDDIRRINEENGYDDNQLESRCNHIQDILDQLRQE